MNLLKYFTKEELEYIRNINNLYLKALAIVDRLFKDKKDKANKPYIYHLYRVSNNLVDLKEKVAALLHDTLEDTCVTYEDLIEVGFPKEILDVVVLVTNDKEPNLSREEKLKIYDEKIDKIINSNNIHAINLKEADMQDNCNEDRLRELPLDSQEWFREKYGKQLIKLRKAKVK